MIERKNTIDHGYNFYRFLVLGFITLDILKYLKYFQTSFVPLKHDIVGNDIVIIYLSFEILDFKMYFTRHI